METSNTQTHIQKVYGCTFLPEDSIHFTAVLRGLLFSKIPVSQCFTILSEVIEHRQFSVAFDCIMNGYSVCHHEADFTNMGKSKLQEEEVRYERLAHWSATFGCLSPTELNEYCRTFNLRLERAERYNREASMTKVRNKRPHTLFETLSRTVIGQEEAKKALSVALFNHEVKMGNPSYPGSPLVPLPKSNLLFIGRSGTGKTLLANCAAKALGVPFVRIDAASLVKSGIVGNSIADYFIGVYHALDHKEDLTNAIVLVDEFDKLGRGLSRENFAIQTELLSIIGEEGVVAFAPERQAPMVTIPTRNMLFIFCGAFEQLSEMKSKKTEIGFRQNGSVSDDTESAITRDDIVHFGFMPEIVNRLGRIVQLHAMTEEHMLDVLQRSEASPLVQYRNLFSEIGISLRYDDEFVRAVAAVAYTSGLNGRGANEILAEIMDDILFDAHSIHDEIIIDSSFLHSK